MDAETRLTRGFFSNQVDLTNNIIRDSYERRDIKTYMDASVVEAINWDIVDTTNPIVKNTLDAFKQYLSISSRPIGYFRTLQQGWYDRQEWVVMDLRIALAYKKLSKVENNTVSVQENFEINESNNNTNHYEDQILNWVTSQSSLNFNIISELYDATTGNYTGAVPMCGFGPGAFLLYFLV
eukprot:TRINITY_DN9004_c0_g1_i1.p1 TRINITY_DN9004_c0_g1~~TRINITY_DN9004_c0_g1_i1.p1  ORF type:complete len:211 (+),score=58.42 TRINITY_DN9004_c0_g1_i1:92-634(+)